MVTDLLGNVLYNNPEVQGKSPAAPIRFRRSSSRLSSYSYDEPEFVRIMGEATLCFEDHGKSFLGVIHCSDGNFYSIVGNRNNNLTEESNLCDCSSSDSSDEEDSLPLLFNIRIKDHDDPTEYNLKDVHVHIGRDCRFKRSNISFNSKTSYRGHKAQLVAQSCLGRGVAMGSDLRVFDGVIDITVMENKPNPRHWVL